MGGLYTLVSDIEKLKNTEYLGQVLNEIKKRHGESFNSFTHTGFHQIARRNTQEHIESNYDKHEVGRIIEFADALALLAVLMLAGLAGSNDLAEEVREKTRQYTDISPLLIDD